MFRSPLELDGLAREHAAHLAAERRLVSRIHPAPLARRGLLLRAVGMTLIRTGERLAGERSIPSRSFSRPATAGRVRS